MKHHVHRSLQTRRTRKKPPFLVLVLALALTAGCVTIMILTAINLDPHVQNTTSHAPQLQPPLPLTISKYDTVYTVGYEQAPVVLEEYKFIFFATAKVGCSEFLKLCRRAMGYSDWNVTDGAKLPYDPSYNGLKFLSSYSIQEATKQMTDPTWTRAIFVRDPKERMVSAYMNKGINDFGNYFYKRQCKGQTKEMCWKHLGSLETFFDYIVEKNFTQDIHWRPQWNRMEAKYWPYINFVGDFKNIAGDAERLLKRVGLWEKYGKSGWGPFGNESMFAVKPGHQTTAAKTTHLHFNNTEFEDRIHEFYKMDYNNEVYSHLFDKSSLVQK